MKGEKTLAEWSQQYDVHTNLINQWRAGLLEGAADVFGADHAAAEPAVDVTMLHAKIGELTLANDFWPVRSGRPVYCRAQSDDRPWSCAAAGCSGAAARHQRGRIYYLPRPVSDTDLTVIRRIDELPLLYPLARSRMLRDLLRQEGTAVGRLQVTTLMKRMRIEAIYRRPNTSKPAPGHKVCPYLLRKLAVTRPNHVWATDITSVPMARGFVYLVAIVDWCTRRALAWWMSILLDAGFCIEALEEALVRYGKPAIFNCDQGAQFTSAAFTTVLHGEQIAISMDGKGCWRDNLFA